MRRRRKMSFYIHTGQVAARCLLKLEDIPNLMPEIKGIYVGGCVCDRDGSVFRDHNHVAHAHSGSSPYVGWICFSDASYIVNRVGYVTRTFIHEYAHVLNPCHGHDQAWRDTMRRLREPLEWKYRPRSRREAASLDFDLSAAEWVHNEEMARMLRRISG